MGGIVVGDKRQWCKSEVGHDRHRPLQTASARHPTGDKPVIPLQPQPQQFSTDESISDLLSIELPTPCPAAYDPSPPTPAVPRGLRIRRSR